MYEGDTIVTINDNRGHFTFLSSGPIEEQVDLSGEHLFTWVYNADGSAKIFVDGVLFAQRLATSVSGFTRYNVSGNMTFKFPYSSSMGANLPLNMKEIRIYERSLTDAEVVQNYKATVSHQNAINFTQG